jgi:cytoskeleton protein RodZ
MTKLGELLKAEREKRGLSLHEIGMNLKINPKILKAIEDGNPADLPAKTFLRGFIKSYAQHLRLDSKMILDMFQEEYGTTRPEEPQKTGQANGSSPVQQTMSAPKYEKPLKRPDDAALPTNSNNRIYTILFAILLLTLIAFVAKMMDKYQKESRVTAPEVTETTIESTTTTTLETAAATSDQEPIATPASSTTTTTVAGATTTSTIGATSGSTTSTSTTSSSTTTLKPTTTSTTTTTTTLKPVTTTTLKAVVPVTTSTTTTTTTSTSTSVTTSTTLKAGSTEVIVEALNKVKIRFTLNSGQKWEQIELNPDQVHTFRTKTSMELEISDGGAVNLIINGRDRGVPGTIGRPIKLAYPK